MIQIPNKTDEAVKKFIEAYGEEAQIRQAMEECGELIVALNKHLRAYKDVCNFTLSGAKKVTNLSETRRAVCEEIADVIIMCCQMAYIHDPSRIDVNAYIQEKIERQLKRLNEVESEKSTV